MTGSTATAEPPVTFEAVQISKRFGPVAALTDATIELRAGEVMALMGENGAGKSTLLKILTGDYRPTAGSLRLDGVDTEFKDPAHAHRAGVRVVAQEPEILDDVSVAENIYVGALRARGRLFDAAALERTVQHDLIEAGFGAFLRPDTLGHQLTAAQRQIVEVMRALLGSPKVICFDEPTSSLGEEEVASLFKLIRRLKSNGVAVAYVSHRLPEIFQLADRVTVLRDGRLVGTRAIPETSTDELVRMMVGRDLSQLFQRTHSDEGEITLRLENLTTDDVTDVNLEVKSGEVVGIAGLVGAGRSELLRAVVGDVPVRAGAMYLGGQSVRFSSPADSVAAGIGFAPEERKAEALVMQRTIRDNIVLAVLPRLARGGFVRVARERLIANDYITRLRIRTPSAEQLVKNLSGGNQQKVVLARWLAISPRLLVLDEPTRGVDVGAKAEIYGIIDQLAAQGTAILLVSSELPEVLGISDRIYVMAKGRLSEPLNRAEATEERILALALNDADDRIDAPDVIKESNEGRTND